MALQLRILGIPVRVDPSLLVILTLLGFGLGEVGLIVAWVVIGSLSVLLHELGHALAYRRFGQRASIVLYAFGGMTQGERELPPARSLGVSLAGPGAQLVLLGAPLLVLASTGAVTEVFWRDVLDLALFINIGWPLFNLVPVLPLDGGNVVRSGVDLVRPGRGMRAAQAISVVVAAIGAVAAAMTGWLFAAAFGAMFAVLNWQALQRGSQPDQGDPLVAGYGALLRGDVSGGRLAATRLAGQRGVAPGAVEELRLWSLVAEGDSRRLAHALDLQPQGFEASALLRGAAAMLADDAAAGRTLVAWSLVHEPQGPALALVADLLGRTDGVAPLAEELLALDDAAPAVRTLQAALHHRGWFRQAAMVGASLLESPAAARIPAALQGEIAADVAASAVRASDLPTASAWLTWAIAAGWHDLARLERDPDLGELGSIEAVGALRRARGDLR